MLGEIDNGQKVNPIRTAEPKVVVPRHKEVAGNYESKNELGC